MKIDLAHVFGATALVGLGHYGLTGLEDAAVSLDWTLKALFGASALQGVLIAQDYLDDRTSKSERKKNPVGDGEESNQQNSNDRTP